MTFMSLLVEQHDTEASAREAHVTAREYAVCGSLDAWSWTASVSSFAATHGLPIDYVDNCWLRVAMDSTLLRLFLHSGPASDQVTRLLDRVDDRKWYVVNEEEF